MDSTKFTVNNLEQKITLRAPAIESHFRAGMAVMGAERPPPARGGGGGARRAKRAATKILSKRAKRAGQKKQCARKCNASQLLLTINHDYERMILYNFSIVYHNYESL